MEDVMRIVFTLFVATLLVAGAAGSEVIYNMQVNPSTEAAVQWNQNVNITFNYKSSYPGGIRIFARPMSGNSLTPGYAASGSGLYTGTGSGSQWFTIGSGNVVVDRIRFQVYSGDQSVLLLQFFVPVKFHFGAHAITDITFSPAAEGSMQNGQQIQIGFSYRTSQPGGVRIFARPMSGSNLTPSYSASGSPLYASGSGSGSGNFTITTGSALVDGIRFQMWDANQTVLLQEFVVPVKYRFAPHAISNVIATPASPNGLLFGENVSISFSYRTSEAGGVRIFPRPFTNGSLTPSYSPSGSPLYATGSGTGTASFTITQGRNTVDAIRFQMWNANQTSLLLEWFVPVNVHFGSAKITSLNLAVPSPAYFTNGENASMTFNYTSPMQVRIFPRPFSGNDLASGYAASGSPLYASGSGSGNATFTITSGVSTVDKIRFLMTNDAQTTELIEWFVPVQYHFGNQPLTDVRLSDAEVPAGFSLSQNYPNPFNPATTIRFALPDQATTSLRVYDIVGKEIATLVNENLQAGAYEIRFDASAFASGTYIYRLQAGDQVATRRMILVK